VPAKPRLRRVGFVGGLFSVAALHHFSVRTTSHYPLAISHVNEREMATGCHLAIWPLALAQAHHSHIGWQIVRARTALFVSWHC